MRKSLPLYMGALLLIAAGALFWSTIPSSPPALSCGEVKEEEVRGRSMEGLVEPGSMVSIRYGFQECEIIQRDDIVAYQTVLNADPLLKVVKGIPGDTFDVGLSAGGVKIFINRQALTNSRGDVYRLHASSYALLSLYVRDYHGVIPKGAYLLLGNTISGTLDSSRFGLVDGAAIVGKMIE